MTHRTSGQPAPPQPAEVEEAILEETPDKPKKAGGKKKVA